MSNNLLLHENVWGSDETPNPFEVLVTGGREYSYGSYLSGLPEYKDEHLQIYYSRLKEFAQWAIENKVCPKCRFPWDSYGRCSCGKYETNKKFIDDAERDALVILEWDHVKMAAWGKQIEIDLQGDSEYAQLSRKGREVMHKRIDRYNRENAKSESILVRIVRKKTWADWFRNISKWFRPSYLIWRFTTPKAERVKSIPLYMATEEIIKDMSFGNKKISEGNCCIRTKGGAVVVIPAGMVNELHDNYKGGEIVAPIIKS